MKENPTRVSSCLAALLLIVSLSGCGLFYKPPGATRTQGVLAMDTERLVAAYENALGGSSNPEILDTRFVKRDGNGWVEIWVVDRKGTRIEYEVTFQPSRRGGTDIRVSLKK